MSPSPSRPATAAEPPPPPPHDNDPHAGHITPARTPNNASSQSGTAAPNRFTSSLSIAVEGAVPIHTPQMQETLITENGGTRLQPDRMSRRSPRKSKTEALAALRAHSRSPSPSETRSAPVARTADSKVLSVPPALDMSSIKTSAPRRLPARTNPRPFGLQDCPVFFPTQDEFKDPMAYIRSISRVSQNHGICKVVPPAGWKMPFVTNTEVSHNDSSIMIVHNACVTKLPS